MSKATRGNGDLCWTVALHRRRNWFKPQSNSIQETLQQPQNLMLRWSGFFSGKNSNLPLTDFTSQSISCASSLTGKNAQFNSKLNICGVKMTFIFHFLTTPRACCDGYVPTGEPS